MKRYSFLLLLFLCGTLIVATMPWPSSLPEPNFSEELYLRLKRGMSVEQVTDILGYPPGDYTQGRGSYVGFCGDTKVEFFTVQFPYYW